jgi:hypothetical protein
MAWDAVSGAELLRPAGCRVIVANDNLVPMGDLGRRRHGNPLLREEPPSVEDGSSFGRTMRGPNRWDTSCKKRSNPMEPTQCPTFS